MRNLELVVPLSIAPTNASPAWLVSAAAARISKNNELTIAKDVVCGVCCRLDLVEWLQVDGEF